MTQSATSTAPTPDPLETSRAAACSSVLSIFISCLVLAGWVLRVEWLTSIFPGYVAMNPVTAFCLIVLGASLWLIAPRRIHGPSRLAAHALAWGVAIVAMTRLLAYFFSVDVAIDKAIFADSIGANRMAPNTAVCLLLLGLSLTTLDSFIGRVWPAQIGALVVATISLVSLVGYGYGASSLYQVGSYIPMALHTAATFQILALGILFSRPERGLVAVLLDSRAGGMVARRLLPAVILIPCALGWLRILGQRLGYYDTELGAALMVAMTVVLFCVAIGWIASVLNKADRERESAVLELKRSSREIHDLYNLAPCGYHSLDRDGIVVAVNDTELAWLGRRREEVIGKMHFSELLTRETRQSFVDSFENLVSQGEERECECELLHQDGTTLPVILKSTAILDGQGQFIASRSTVFDATERRRAEQAMRQFNEELEQRVIERSSELAAANADLLQKNQENEMFVYSVSHDLRSPLVNLQGFSKELGEIGQQIRKIFFDHPIPEDVQRQGVRLIDEDMQRCNRFIQSAVARLSAIIDALLRLSRAGRVEYEPQRVETKSMVARIVESMSAEAYDRGAAVDVRELPDAWGDATAFEQVFANLIGNALNYLDPKRPGVIEIGSCEPDITEADDSRRWATCYVKDNGLGISQAYQAKVFQPLKRLHPEAAKGEGIGLALVRRIVERHGGAIWFESQAGQGSTFYIKLPTTPAAERPFVGSNKLHHERSKRHDSPGARNLAG
jgi:PAS domain S-box-containing protein